MKKIFFLALISFLLGSVIKTNAQAKTKEWTSEQAKEWFSKKEWLGGLQIQPHESIDIPEFSRQYRLNKAYWDKAFSFLKEQDPEKLAVGRYAIDGDNVFAIVTQNPTKEYDSTQWESHRNYVDLHDVISGEEKIGVSPINNLTVTKPYDPAKDLVNYSGKGSIYPALPGTFFLFFPTDAHRPGISAGGNQPDKKIVIKIRYAGQGAGDSANK